MKYKDRMPPVDKCRELLVVGDTVVFSRGDSLLFFGVVSKIHYDHLVVEDNRGSTRRIEGSEEILKI